MRIGKIAGDSEYWIDEQFENLPIFGNSIVFQIEKFWQFVGFPSCEI